MNFGGGGDDGGDGLKIGGLGMMLIFLFSLNALLLLVIAFLIPTLNPAFF